MSRSANPVTLPLAQYSPKHFLLGVADGGASVTLNRPERKNPLTFESYRELTDFFRACAMDDEVKTVVISGAGGNFSSGGDVFEIIGPLVQMDTKGLTAFTRLTGDLVKAMRAGPQRIVAAGEAWGFFSGIVTPEQVLPQAQLLAKQITEGPTFANTMTKRMLAMEWAMSVEEAIEAEAIAQALCMTTADFTRAFEAFSNKAKPVFQGN